MSRVILRGDDTGLRRCVHVAAASHVEPLSTGCPQCLEHGEDWVELWLCLSCGWVACAGKSPNRHAEAHYEETGHPVAVSLRDGPHLRWCYVHKRPV